MWPCQQCNAQNIAVLVPNSGAGGKPRYHHGRVSWHGTARHQMNEMAAWSRMPPNRKKWWHVGPCHQTHDMVVRDMHHATSIRDNGGEQRHAIIMHRIVV
jgi:hypothetical protein